MTHWDHSTSWYCRDRLVRAADSMSEERLKHWVLSTLHHQQNQTLVLVLLKALQIRKCRMHWFQHLARGAPGLRILKGDFKVPLHSPHPRQNWYHGKTPAPNFKWTREVSYVRCTDFLQKVNEKTACLFGISFHWWQCQGSARILFQISKLLTHQVDLCLHCLNELGCPIVASWIKVTIKNNQSCVLHMTTILLHSLLFINRHIVVCSFRDALDSDYEYR
jgi:hypothetical protein